MRAGARGAFSEEDRRFMRMALSLAERGRGATRPNPVVGAVLVRRGAVIAKGWHRGAGLPHAEREALDEQGGKARGATLYVTLEPCCHTGRTGPCTTPVIASGVARVVVGCRDENPLVDGRGIARLRRAGLRVDVGCLEEACRAQNRAFFRWIRERRPWVTLKVASTLDGFIAPRPKDASRGRISWITGPEARRAAHRLRAEHDAVLVGAGTVRADDPRLDVRLPGVKAQPLRVVLDGRLSTTPQARLLGLRSRPRPLIVGCRQAGPARQGARLERAGAEVLLLPGSSTGMVPLPVVLRALAARGVQSVLVEGGSRVWGELVAERLVDGVAWFIAPRLAGAGVPVVQGPGLVFDSPLLLATPTLRRLGEDILISAEVLRGPRRRAR